jgi:predicted Zn-dependent peptidase
MSSIGKSQLILNRIKTPDEIIESLDAVSQDKITKLIDKIFDFSKTSLSIVGKIDNINLKEIKKICLID